MKVIALFLIIISICIGLAFSSNNTVQQSQESLSASNPNYKTITYPQYGYSVEIPKRFVYQKLPYLPDLVDGFHDPAEKDNSTFINIYESEDLAPPNKDEGSGNARGSGVVYEGVSLNKNGVETHKLRAVITVEGTTFYHRVVDVYYKSQNTERVVTLMMYSKKELVDLAEFNAIMDSIKTF